MAESSGDNTYASDWRITRRLITRISREDIARYAGSSGDFNLVHIDEPYATQVAGLPSVIAHGMFTMALTGSFVTSTFGHESVRRFGGRFLAPVFPGDSLDCSVTVRSTMPEGADTNLILDLRTSKDDGVTVFVGEATVSVPSQHT